MQCTFKERCQELVVPFLWFYGLSIEEKVFEDVTFPSTESLFCRQIIRYNQINADNSIIEIAISQMHE